MGLSIQLVNYESAPKSSIRWFSIVFSLPLKGND